MQGKQTHLLHELQNGDGGGIAAQKLREPAGIMPELRLGQLLCAPHDEPIAQGLAQAAHKAEHHRHLCAEGQEQHEQHHPAGQVRHGQQYAEKDFFHGFPPLKHGPDRRSRLPAPNTL